MIRRQRTLFYFVGDQAFPSLAEAQKADLLAILPPEVGGTAEAVADWLLANAGLVATILTTTPRSRNRKSRRDKGVPRKVKAEVVP